jgi:hypothetical protein
MSTTNVSLNNFNEFNFTHLLTKCMLIYSLKRTGTNQIDSHVMNQQQPNQSTLKSILNALLNLSSNSIENKSTICHVNGALTFLLDIISCTTSDSGLILLAMIATKPDDSVTELAICLIRSLSVYYSMNDHLRTELNSLKFYNILLDMALTSSNLNIVSNACCILWSMTSRSSADNGLLFSLGIESRLKSLSYSTSKLISMASLATLKNLYSSGLNKSAKPGSSSSDSSPSTSTSPHLTSSLSSSSSYYSGLNVQLGGQQQPLLVNRTRKQNLEISNEFMQNINKIAPQQDRLVASNLVEGRAFILMILFYLKKVWFSIFEYLQDAYLVLFGSIV